MVLVRAGGDRLVQKIVWEPKWGTSSPSVTVLESEDGNKETLHQKRVHVRQRRKVWQILARHFAHFLKLFRPPLCYLHRCISSPAPSTYMLHMVTTDIYLHISGYSSARGILCACVFLVMKYKIELGHSWATITCNFVYGDKFVYRHCYKFSSFSVWVWTTTDITIADLKLVLRSPDTLLLGLQSVLLSDGHARNM